MFTALRECLRYREQKQEEEADFFHILYFKNERIQTRL